MPDPSSRGVIDEIAGWSIEAKEEDTDRYFYHFTDVNLIERGQKNYVIGRKGTGKTAIAEYINNRRDYGVFSKMLSFKNFPFNILYDLKDSNFTAPNQYITIWEFVIYNSICSMMAENELVSSLSPVPLRRIFDIDVEKALKKSIIDITSPGYALGLFGGSIEKSPGVAVESPISWRDKVDAIRQFICDYSDDSTYYIIFDALDEDYKDVLEPDRRQRYFQLLVSLFKAVQNVRFQTEGLKANIVPLIFIRDDIFDLCRDPDKNKWMDRAVLLDWDFSSLEALVAFRISRAAGSDAEILPFSGAWSTVFHNDVIRRNSKRSDKEELIRFMLRSTFLRPRDIISYLRCCAGIARDLGHEHISIQDVRDADETHSEYMRREVIDEMYSIVDDIAEILDIFSEMRKSIFSRYDFASAYDQFYHDRGLEPKLNFTEMLKLLYHFNVIGNVTTGNHQVFAYNTHKKSMNINENFAIHRGLLKCLHIL